jgi:hypothetical protein
VIRVFIGYDPVEAGTLYTLAHSIQTRSSIPVSITPVALSSLRGILTRDRHPLQSNDFSFSRFLVPWMSGFEGWSIFMDCDMVVTDDIAKLWAWRDDKYAVRVVKHNYTPPEETKYLGNVQTQYGRKNWSSVILFNNARCKTLTPDYVNTADGLDLHQFRWLQDEEIGELPNHWNKLVGYDKTTNPSLIHYTTGGPYFKQYAHCEHHHEWWKEFTLMTFIKNE